MPQFPYIFGVRRDFAAHGVEKAHGVVIDANDPDAAVAWGERIAELYISRLYGVQRTIVGYNNTLAEDLAGAATADWPRVRVGELPDFTIWLDSDAE